MLRRAVLAGVVAVAACTDYGASPEAPPAPVDGGGPDAADVEGGSSVDAGGGEDGPGATRRCVSPNLILCADFDGPDPFVGWQRVDEADPGALYEVVTSPFVSSPHAMKLAIDGADSGADSRLYRTFGGDMAPKIEVSGSLWLQNADGTEVSVVRVSTSEDHAFVLRANGAVFETMPSPDGGTDVFVQRLSPQPIAGSKWIDFVMAIDFLSQQVAVTAGGAARTSPIGTTSAGRATSLTIGAYDPRNTTSLEVAAIFDDVAVRPLP